MQRAGGFWRSRRRGTTRAAGHLALALLLPSGIACGDDTRVQREAAGEAAVELASDGEAILRVLHAIPAEGPIDIVSGDSQLVAGLGFRRVSAYARVAANAPAVRILRAGAPGDTLAREVSVPHDGHSYTIIAMGSADSGAVEAAIIRDDPRPQHPAKAQLRIVNAAANSAPLDVFLGQDDAPFLTDVRVGADPGYRELDAGTLSLTIRPGGQRAVLLRIPSLTLERGQRVTLVLARASPRGGRLSAIRLTDATEANATAADPGR